MDEPRLKAQAPVDLGFLDRLIAGYPAIGSPVRIVRQSGSANSRGALFEGPGGRFFAKGVNPVERSAMALAAEHALVDHLRSGDFPAPEPLRDLDGASVVPDGGWLWVIWRAAKGEDRYRDASVFAPFEPADLASAGEALARFHEAAIGLAVGESRPFEGLVAQYALGSAVDPLTEAERAFASRGPSWEFLVSQPEFGEAFSLFDQLRCRIALPGGVTHGDWIKRNLFFSGHEVSAVIDFDLWNVGPWLFDLALALTAAAYPWPLLASGGEPRLAHADLLLAGYEAIRPLEPEERQSLPAMLATCRFEFHLSLAATTAERGDFERGTRFWQGQVALLRWWYDRGQNAGNRP